MRWDLVKVAIARSLAGRMNRMNGGYPSALVWDATGLRERIFTILKGLSGALESGFSGSPLSTQHHEVMRSWRGGLGG